MGLVKSVCALQLLYLVKPTKITLRFDEFNRAITDGLDTCDKHKGAGSRTYDTMSWRREENNGVNIADQDSKKVLQESLNVIGSTRKDLNYLKKSCLFIPALVQVYKSDIPLSPTT